MLKNGSVVHNQTIMNKNGYDHLTYRPPTVLLENGSMVHNQANTNRNGNTHLMCQPPTVLLENDSMVHNLTNVDRLRKLRISDLSRELWLAP